MVNYPKRNERKAGGVAEESDGWTREEDGGGVRQPLIYLGFLLSGGKKAGKQVIRSTGLSIEVGVGGT